MSNPNWNRSYRKRVPPKSVPSINFRSKITGDCAYCPNLIRPGMPVTRDYEARQLVHAGCYQRVNGAILRANKVNEEVAA